MGNALEAEQCYEEALRCFNEGLALEPENGDLALAKGKLLDELERTDEAVEAYAAAAAHAKTAEPFARLADALVQIGRPADALVPADEGCSRFPKDPRVRFAGGRARLVLGRAAEALSFLQESFALQPDADVRRELTRALVSLNRPDEALRELAENRDPESLLCRVDLLSSLGRAQEALAACDAAIRAAPVAADVAYHRKGKLLLDLGRTREALAAFDAALGLNPADAEVWCDAALAWRKSGQESKARKLLDRALEIDPGFDRALRLKNNAAPVT
jgi:tetratricopeptide (TPR) repeat protein